MLSIRVIIRALLPALAMSMPAHAQDEWIPNFEGEVFYLGGHATDGTYLYLVGANQDGVAPNYPDYLRQLRRYDPAADAWDTLSPLPVMSQYNTAAYSSGRLFSFGGFDGSGPSGAIYAYDISTDTWETLGATLNVPRYFASAAAVGEKIYVMGGMTNTSGAVTASNEEFDVVAETVAARAGMGQPRYRHAAAVLDGRVYVIGGFMGQATTSVLEYSPPDPDDPFLGNTWSSRAALGEARYSPAAFALNGFLYVTGGDREEVPTFDDTWRYSRATNSWTQGPDMNSARVNHAAVAIGDRGYVYGGGGGSTLITGETFDPNESPVAVAGPDQTVQATASGSASVTLDGSGSSDPDDDTLNYTWSTSSGSASGSSPTVNLPAGVFIVTLTVEDPWGGSSTDTVVITVTPGPAPPPVEEVVIDEGGGGGGSSGGCGSVGLDLMLPLLAIALWKRRRGKS